MSGISKEMKAAFPAKLSERVPRRTDDLLGFLKMIRQMVHERAPALQIKEYLTEAINEVAGK